jgi:5-methylcytosine-specific restriction protein A
MAHAGMRPCRVATRCAVHPLAAPADKVAAAQHERQRTAHEPWRKWYHRAQWKKLRGLCLARDPVCKMCNREASTVADHIRPHRGIWALFCDLANLQGLCKPCHDKKTATEDGGFGTGPKATNAPVVTGETGKQFVSSSVGEDAIDRALREEI